MNRRSRLVLLVATLLAAVAGCATSGLGRDYPLPLPEKDLNPFLTNQAYTTCETDRPGQGPGVVINFLEKDGEKYLLAGTEADPATQTSRWVTLLIDPDPSRILVWLGTFDVASETATIQGSVPYDPGKTLCDWLRAEAS